MTTEGSLAPKQQRSRETLRRLLKATAEVLNEHGLDGATIPRIAAVAGVAPASVYRRFKDRDALYRAALLQVLEGTAAANSSGATADLFKRQTLREAAREMIGTMLRQYRLYSGLLRALTRLIQLDTDEAFRNKAFGIVSENNQMFANLLLQFRSEITHPDPERAIKLGLATIATLLEERSLPKYTLVHELLPSSDEELQDELTRSFVAYLRS